MPPKGSRKAQTASSAAVDAPPAADADGAAEVQEDTGEGIEAYQLPKAPVLKLAKAAGPQNMKFAKEVPVALQKASTVFVSYLAATAHDIASGREEKTLSAQHVLEACKHLDWDDEDELLRVLKSELDSFRRGNKAKKEASKAAKAAPTMETADGPTPVAVQGTSGKSASVLSASTLGKRPRMAEEAEGKGQVIDEDQETVEDEDAVRYFAQGREQEGEEDVEGEEAGDVEEEEEEEEDGMEVDEAGTEEVEDGGLQDDDSAPAARGPDD